MEKKVIQQHQMKLQHKSTRNKQITPNLNKVQLELPSSDNSHFYLGFLQTHPIQLDFFNFSLLKFYFVHYSFQFIEVSLLDFDKIYQYYIIKLMNHLEFSPISEKDEESLDTFSFLHKQCQSHRVKYSPLTNEGCTKLFDRFDRSIHNRKSYGFQLLKQFILFSSDEQTIEIHYKYMHYELEQGVSHLENSYGLRLKLTLGKALEDIKNFSRKKKAYENPIFINRLASVYDKVLHLNKQQSYRSVIKILAQYIQKEVILSKEVLSQVKQKNTINLVKNLQKQIQKDETSIEPKPKQAVKEIKQKLSDLRLTKKQDFMKTAKFTNFCESKLESSRWKQQVQSVDSYEEQPQIIQPRVIAKSMSNQIHDYPLHSISAISSRERKFVESKSKQTKCMSISITPARPNSEQYIFQTKKKKSSASDSRNSQSITNKVVQNVIIIRGSKSHRRQPDRFIRVPVVSDEIKIVEMLADSERRNSSRYKSSVDHEIYKTDEKYLESTRNRTQKKHKNMEKIRKQSWRLSQKQAFEQEQTHECLGCKFCSIVKEMQTYRMQRKNKADSGYRLL